jgi:HlyD family secretion protein
MNSHRTQLFVTAWMVLLCGCESAVHDFAVGTVERDRIELVADTTEPIVAINVLEGDRVEKGSELIVQDNARIAAKLAKALAERDLALARLQEAEAGPRVQALDRSRARLAARESAVTTAQLELEREKSLIRQNYASESRVNILQGRHDEAVARLEEGSAELAELLEGTRIETVDQARAALNASNAVVSDLQISMARSTVRSPVAGVVESLPFELGERPPVGLYVVAVLADGRTYARVHIPEPVRTRLRSGTPATLRIDGYKQEFAGQIRWISNEAAYTPYYALTQRDRSRLSYLAEIDFLDAGDIPSGIPVEARFPTLAK